ncbi:MAG: ATP-binding cassette domain-containing protein [Pseudomonadota bacterium]
MYDSPWLKFLNATFSWGSNLVLDNMSLTIESSYRKVWVTGPSGSGKSTLLRIVAGHYQLDNGKCKFLNHNVDGPSSDRSILLQNYKLFPWLTLEENISIGLKFKGVDSSTTKEKVDNYLHKSNLFAFKDLFPHQLSGGMQQRCALLRNLAISPSCLLLDEPFSALDEENTKLMLNLIDEYLEQEIAFALIVSHTLRYSSFDDELIINLSGDNGKIIII